MSGPIAAEQGRPVRRVCPSRALQVSTRGGPPVLLVHDLGPHPCFTPQPLEWTPVAETIDALRGAADDLAGIKGQATSAARIAALEAMVRALADDVEAAADAEYPADLRAAFPLYRSRHHRDTETVRAARALLGDRMT